MPIKKSALKALRQTHNKNEKNTRIREQLTYLQRVIRKSLSEKDLKQAAELSKNLIKAADKAAQNGIIKKNTASRMKSRLAAQLKIATK